MSWCSFEGRRSSVEISLSARSKLVRSRTETEHATGSRLGNAPQRAVWSVAANGMHVALGVHRVWSTPAFERKNQMKNALTAAAVAVVCSSPIAAHAQAAAAKPEPEYTFTGNLTIASDYRFRGFTQTDYQPA